MGTVIERLIQSYGSPLILERNGVRQKFRGFLQSLLYRKDPVRIYSPSGEVSRGRYLFIGPLAPGFADGDILIKGKRRYELRQAEEILCGDAPLYYWGMCVEIGRDA